MQLNLFNLLIRRRLKPPAQPKAPRPPVKTETISERELRALWLGLRRHFFPDRHDLDNYRVYWSRSAQKRTLASCSLETRAIRVARELNHAQHKCWLSPLLYHEMCHAYLGFSVHSADGRSRWHGPEFKRLERRHPGIARFDAWIKNGGWEKAVRSDRARRAYKKRKHAA